MPDAPDDPVGVLVALVLDEAAPAPFAPVAAAALPSYRPKRPGRCRTDSGVAPMPLGVTPAAHGPAPVMSQAGGWGAMVAR